jgi:hypothetical protein
MKLAKCVSRVLALASFLVLPTLTWAQTQPQPSEPTEYKPSVGQEGKDVVWVPTAMSLVQKMLDIAEVTNKDFLVDLGSGDGRTAIAAGKRGARALGIEYNPDMVELSKRNAIKEGVADKVTFKKADIFQSDFSKATVLTLFLLPDINVKLRPKILKMKPGVRVVANSFTMGDWSPDQRVQISEGDCTTYCTALLWVVPANVQGTWRTPRGELRLQQTYQLLTGTLGVGKKAKPISDAKMTGGRIEFSVGDDRYKAEVRGSAMKGVRTSAARQSAWQARRIRS